MNATDTHLALPRRVRQVWRRTQSRHLAAGAIALMGWAIAVFLLLLLIDWMLDLPTAGRIAGLVVLLGVCLTQAWRQGWRELSGFDATRTALQIESRLGGMQSLIVTAIQFGQSGSSPAGSDSLEAFTQRKAEEAASDIHAKDVVVFEALRRPAMTLALLAAAMIAVAAVNGPLVSTGLARLFMPWIDVPYPTNTQIDLDVGDIVVNEGGTATIVARLSGVIPDQATIAIRTGSGRPRKITLDVANDACQYTVASAFRDFTYRIKAGDAQSTWRRVRVISAPRIEQVQVRLTYPAYLQRTPETVEALTLTAPEGSTAQWRLTLDRPVREASMNRDGQPLLPIQVSESGRQVTVSAPVIESQGYNFSWVDDEHGFAFESPRYFLQVASDQVPRVELTSPSGHVNAMLGRELQLAARIYDDHGIVSSKIVYRLNQTPERATPLPAPLSNTDGEQPIAWDYREALTDLAIGDTVSFAVEVSDAYPGEQGPHVARSETRRITFLSEAEYLEQINKQKDRLLSRVRTLYRQQREAHELVLFLDPSVETYIQTCQLEAVRQEMLRDQLIQTAGEFTSLLEDLAANNIDQAEGSESLAMIRSALLAIADTHIAQAATQLRDQVDHAADPSSPPDPMAAARVINIAARELGKLVLQRDIRSAREVFSREAHMLAQVQSLMRFRTLTQSSASEPDIVATLANRQDELGAWIDDLIADLQRGMRYEERPLAVIRLSRLVRQMQADDLAGQMKQAAGQLRSGSIEQATVSQSSLIRSLLAFEFEARTGAEFAALTDARELFESQATALATIRATGSELSADQLLRRQGRISAELSTIRRKLLIQPVPIVPAASPELFDVALPQPPAVEPLLKQVGTGMAGAIDATAAGDFGAADEHQQQVEQALTELAIIFDQRIEELALQAEGAVRLAARVYGRLKRIEELDTQQLRLMELVFGAADGELKDLVEPQAQLTEDVNLFVKQLQMENDQVPAFAKKDVQPLMRELAQVVGAMTKATAALKVGQSDAAIEIQESAAEALASASSKTQMLLERLETVSSMRQFQNSVRFASQSMADIVDEQRAALAVAQKMKPNELTALVPVVKNLIAAASEVAPVLDVVGTRVDAGSALLFASSDMEDALFAVEEADKEEAIDAQDIATDSLGEVQALVESIVVESGYVAEIVEFLYGAQAEADVLLSRQQEIREELTGLSGSLPGALVTQQRRLQTDGQTYGSQLELATGMATYGDAGRQLLNVLGKMESGDVAAATEAITLAQTTLTEDLAELFEVMKLLRELPASPVTIDSPKELLLLIDCLALASKHRDLTRRTAVAESDQLAELAEVQAAMLLQCGKLIEGDPPNANLVMAQKRMAEATAAMQPLAPKAVAKAQQAADDALRHFVIEQTLLIIQLVEAGPSDPVPAENYEPGSDEFVDWAAGVVSGELPTDKQVEWESLGRRTRAALNENFVRELPLEYRGMLKNYYERLAK